MPAISVAYSELLMNFPTIFVLHDSMITISFIPTGDVVLLYAAAKHSTATRREGHLFFESKVFQLGFSICLVFYLINITNISAGLHFIHKLQDKSFNQSKMTAFFSFLIFFFKYTLSVKYLCFHQESELNASH